MKIKLRMPEVHDMTADTVDVVSTSSVTADASPIVLNQTDNLHFATFAKSLATGLFEQLKRFVKEHPGTNLIIIDTLQKIREVNNDRYSYANDYEIIGQLKAFALKLMASISMSV